MSQSVLERPVPASVPVDETVSTPAPTGRPLTALDRCDSRTTTLVDGRKSYTSCGAQAFFRAVLPSGGEVLFCGHCMGAQPTKNQMRSVRRQALLDAGAVIESFYETINLKPTESSEAKSGKF